MNELLVDRLSRCSTCIADKGLFDDNGMCELAAVDILWVQFLLMMRTPGSGGGDSPGE